jgi:hypothetical protein
MPESLNIAIFAFGAVLVLIGLLGGKFKLFGSEVSGTVGTAPRVASLFFGLALIGWGLLAEAKRPAGVATEPVLRREKSEPVQDTPRLPVETRPVAAAEPKPVPAVNLSGMWQDEMGTVYRINHHGTSFEFEARNLTSGVSAEGRGTLQGQTWETSFRTSYFATGTGRGVLSSDGNQMTGSFNDTQYGAYAHTIIRLQ